MIDKIIKIKGKYSYPAYLDFFTENNLGYLKEYFCIARPPIDCQSYIVLATGKHQLDNHVTMVVILGFNDLGVYLIDTEEIKEGI
jgi:hypothetical protein